MDTQIYVVWIALTIVLIHLCQGQNQTRPLDGQGCSTGDCDNGGGCVANSNCECSSAWQGRNCDQLAPDATVIATTGQVLGNIDYVTDGVLCRNGGSFTFYNYNYEGYERESRYVDGNYGDGYYGNGEPGCLCYQPWTGPDCGTHVCHDYCQHGGSCDYAALNSGARCFCPPPYLGSRCQYTCEDSCSSHSIGCQHEPIRDVIICECAPGYYGDACEVTGPPGDCSRGEGSLHRPAKHVKDLKKKWLYYVVFVNSRVKRSAGVRNLSWRFECHDTLEKSSIHRTDRQI